MLGTPERLMRVWKLLVAGTTPTVPHRPWISKAIADCVRRAPEARPTFEQLLQQLQAREGAAEIASPVSASAPVLGAGTPPHGMHAVGHRPKALEQDSGSLVIGLSQVVQCTPTT